MANRTGVKIKGDPEDFADVLDNMDGISAAIAVEWMRETLPLLRDRAEANAPLDTGELKLSITYTEPEIHGNIVEGFVSAEAYNPDDGFDYALAMHEYQDPAFPAQWGKGPKTAQIQTPEGGAGGKFIERPATYFENLMTWRINLAQKTRQVLSQMFGRIRKS